MATSHTRFNSIIHQMFDTNNTNIASKAASGLENHMENLKPELGRILIILHANLVNHTQHAQRKEVLASVQKESHWKKTMPVTFAAKTHWDGTHDETKTASVNQRKLETMLTRLYGYRRVDEELYQ